MRPRSRREKRASRDSDQARHGVSLPKVSRRAKLGSAVARASVMAGLLLVAAFAACGGDARGPVVVRVGQAAISKATVDHWARVIERGGTLGGVREEPHDTPTQRAVAFLVSADWLSGETAVQGLTVSDHAVDQALTERKEANGGAEFRESLDATGQTLADVKLEVRAELARAAIRRMLTRRAAQITEPEISGYYTNHRSSFRVAERRVFDLIKNLPSQAVARALARRLGTGSRFTKKAVHETLDRPSILDADTEKHAVLRAVFTSSSGMIVGPMRFKRRWTLFVVREVEPARTEPLALAKVRSTVVKRLTAEREQQIVSEFTKAYRIRWTARTSCDPGFLAQGCAQYHGPIEPEGSTFTSAE